MAHNIIRTEIPERLQALPVLTFCKAYRKYRPIYAFPPYNAEPLLDLCSKVVDALPMPDCWTWTPNGVGDWFETELNYPEYRETILRNLINGRTLILLEADKLPRVNIKNFEIIKRITAAIRQLYKVDQDEFKRSISLPIRRPETLFLWYRAKHYGPIANNTTRSQYFRKINIIRDETTEERRYYALLNHWNRIPPFRPWCPKVLIGAIRRINPMTGTRQRMNYHPKPPPYLLKNLNIYKISKICLGSESEIGETDEEIVASCISLGSWDESPTPTLITLPSGLTVLEYFGELGEGDVWSSRSRLSSEPCIPLPLRFHREDWPWSARKLIAELLTRPEDEKDFWDWKDWKEWEGEGEDSLRLVGKPCPAPPKPWLNERGSSVLCQIHARV